MRRTPSIVFSAFFTFWATTAAAQSCPLPVSLSIGRTVNGERGAFAAVVPGPPLPCWTYQWNFGDRSPLSSEATPTHQFGIGTFTVTLTIVSTEGTKSATINVKGEGEAQAPANVFFSIPTPRPTAAEPVVFVASARSLHPITEWRWDFGDNTTSAGQGLQTVTHAYQTPGAYTVTARAVNSYGVSSPAIRAIVVASPVPQPFSMTIPVVVHSAGLNGSLWQTDLHVFAPPPATSPVILDLDLHGTKRTISSSSLTHVARDVVRTITGGNGAGVLRISGVGFTTPRIWTRTYNVSSAGTFGQAIPALANANSLATQASPLLIGGLEENERLRTNLGLMNLSSAEISVRIDVIKRSGSGGSTTVIVPAGSLVQFNLAARLPGVAGSAACGIRLTSSRSNVLYAYASVIDAVTNDPTFIEAVREDELDESELMIPGVGHVGAWRSDLTLFNPTDRFVKVRLEFRDEQAEVRGVAEGIEVAPRDTLTLRDIVRNEVFTSAPKTDLLGTMTVDVLAGPRPLVFARTYNQQAPGTFGQGIPSIDPLRPNVRQGEKAVIVGVLENADTYTNLGLMSVGRDAVVRITLMHGRDSRVLGVHQVRLQGGESRIIGNIVKLIDPSATEGTLQVEVIDGYPVWAYGSLVDRRTRDPEYIPAMPMP